MTEEIEVKYVDKLTSRTLRNEEKTGRGKKRRTKLYGTETERLVDGGGEHGGQNNTYRNFGG